MPGMDKETSLKFCDYRSYPKKPEEEKYLIIGWQERTKAVLLGHEPSWRIFIVSHLRTPDPGRGKDNESLRKLRTYRDPHTSQIQSDGT